MKAILFTIAFFAAIVGPVYAVPMLDPTHAFDFSEIVIIGQILSVEILSEPEITKTENYYREVSGIALYEIQVEESFKNPDNAQTISVPGLFLREPHGMSYETYPYEAGQRVLLYLQENKHEYAGTELIIRSGDSRMLENGLCEVGYYFDKGNCVIIDDATEVPLPPCKSGPKPDGEGWVFVGCNWQQYADVPVENCNKGSAPASKYAWNSQECVWEWSPMRNENKTGPRPDIPDQDGCGLGNVLIDGVCQKITDSEYILALDAYEKLNDRTRTDSEFDKLMQTEIVGFGVDDPNKGIFITVEPNFATKENFAKYENIFRETIGDDIPVGFEIGERGSLPERKDPEYLLLVLIPVLALVGAIFYLSRKRR